ncbi:MAG TPA: hypothetical protein VHE35_34340 [Kofleriaceae bacterium]|nr:hypothetical protein [Kofleriaceae bacterium]
MTNLNDDPGERSERSERSTMTPGRSGSPPWCEVCFREARS